MQSRYDFMTESVVLDTDFGTFPDVLSLNYNGFKASQALEAIELNDAEIEKFWWTVEKRYGTAEFDDMVLTLNGISHKNFLKEGDIIFIPARVDIFSSFSKEIS